MKIKNVKWKAWKLKNWCEEAANSMLLKVKNKSFMELDTLRNNCQIKIATMHWMQNVVFTIILLKVYQII